MVLQVLIFRFFVTSELAHIAKYASFSLFTLQIWRGFDQKPPLSFISTSQLLNVLSWLKNNSNFGHIRTYFYELIYRDLKSANVSLNSGVICHEAFFIKDPLDC